MKKIISLILAIFSFLYLNCYADVDSFSPFKEYKNYITNGFLVSICNNPSYKMACDMFFVGFLQAIATIPREEGTIDAVKPFDTITMQDVYFHYLSENTKHLSTSDRLVIAKMPASFTILAALDNKGYVRIKYLHTNKK